MAGIHCPIAGNKRFAPRLGFIRAAVLFLPGLFSCGMWLLPPLEVESVSIGEAVEILFSAAVEPGAVRRAFSLTEDNNSMEGQFVITSRSLTFTPFNGIKANHKYEIRLSTLAEDLQGNSLVREFRHVFYTKDDLTPPEILSVFPDNEESCPVPPSFLSFTFSKSVDPLTFERAFSLSPSLDLIPLWTENNTQVRLIPAKPFAVNTWYTLRISPLLSDAAGNFLQEAFTSVFLCAQDLLPPEFTLRWEPGSPRGGAGGNLPPGESNESLPTDCRLLLTFDEGVKIEQVSGFLEMIPALNFSSSPDLVLNRELELTFPTPPAWGQSRTLKVKKGISDLAGNLISSERAYTLNFNHPAYRPPVFAGGFLKTGLTQDPTFFLINQAADFSRLLLSQNDFPPGEERETKLYLVFWISPAAQSLSLVEALGAVHFSCQNNCAEISLRTTAVLTPGEYQALEEEITALNGSGDLIPPDSGGGKLCALGISLEVTNQDEFGLIVFTLDKSIADNLGNAMADPVILTFNKN
ncbi:MAG: Ig-like domain-containing protein [Spirochaetales bacterium]|jgi:hypothetical protein|nr:Ig-like domain-containing protein [Spirochaetales bacterium]